MREKWFAFLLVVMLVLPTLGACGGSLDALSPASAQVEEPGGSATATVTISADPAATAVAESDPAEIEVAAPESRENPGAGADSVAEALAENDSPHGGAGDDAWDDATATHILLDGGTVSVEGVGAAADGSTVTITAAGTYVLRGSLTDGQIRVLAEEEEIVRLVLDGVEIHSSTGAPIAVLAAEETVIVLAAGSQNSISDAASYVFEDPEVDEPNAALFAKSDLTICGEGSLTVQGNYNDGIASKDGLLITGGAIAVQAVDDGIRGKDYVVVRGGNVTVDAQGDGLKADNEEDAARGYILVEDGVLNITAGGDALDAKSDALIVNGEISLSAGGGSQASIEKDASAKGIKAAVAVVIDGGTLTIDAVDDAIHSNGSLVVNGGVFVLSTGDDAMHADSSLTINGGQIRITDSYEGIESSVITIQDGDIYIVSSDDGINVAAGIDGSGMNPGPGRGGGRGLPPGQGTVPSMPPGQGTGPGMPPGQGTDPGMPPGQWGGAGGDGFTYSGDFYLYIHGGIIAIESGGDGLDVNGAIEMTGGVVLVHGPVENMNGALDYDGGFKISGGLLVAVGSAGMAQAPDESSSQYSVLLNLSGTLPAETLLHVQSEGGDPVLTFAPAKQVQSVVLSSPDLKDGATYDVYYGGSSTGQVRDGLYQGGAYTGGTELGSFTISGVVTRLGGGRR